jgi:YebC/PmpR family DNA-binding regulatory protein
MSGHSKWHNIKIKKSKMDNIRGAVFTRISKEIHMAVKDGGPDPEINYRLKMAVQKAKDNNMPGDSIKKTIEKAMGAGSADFEEIMYEGYGPAGVAMMLDVATDNRNRSAAEVRNLYTKYGGNLGETGCVSWMFDKKGVIFIADPSLDEDNLMNIALEAGADDLQKLDDGYEITSEPSSFMGVRKALDDKKIPFESAEISWIPKNTVRVTGADVSRVLKLIEVLEELDDVNQVYANFDISPEDMEKYESS